MSESFAASASRLAALAAQGLGWRPNDFWHATPDELALSLRDPNAPSEAATLSRADLNQLMERDRDG